MSAVHHQQITEFPDVINLAEGFQIPYTVVSLKAYGAVGDGFVDDRAALAAADAAAGDGEILLQAGTYKIASNITVSSNINFLPGAIIKPASGVTVTLSGQIGAGRYQIFNGDTIALPGKQPIFPEWHGADNTGASDSLAAFDSCITSLASGGTILGAGPGAKYQLSADLDISTSYITIDGQMATFTTSAAGAHWFEFDGEGASDGDWGSVVKHPVVRNCIFGQSATDNFVGPWFFWCEDGLIENCHIVGDGGTTLNIFRNRRTVARNITIDTAYPGGIGVLLMHSEDCLLEDIKILGGPFVYGIQVKGGYNNRVSHCIVRDAGADVETRVGIRSRGDSPVGSSTTGWTRYPFSQYTHDGIAFVDSNPDTITTDASDFIEHGFEAPFELTISGSAQNDGTYTCESMSATTLTLAAGDSLTAEAKGETVTITVGWDDMDPRRASHNTTISDCAVVDSFEATTLIAFKAQEAIGTRFERCFAKNVKTGISVTRTSCELERDFIISNCRVEDTEQHGIAAAGTNGNNLPNVKILNSTVHRAGYSGFDIDYTDDILIDGVTAHNCDQAAATKSGINIDHSTRPRVLNSTCYDDQGSATQDYGILITANCTDPSMINCYGNGNVTYQVYSPIPGNYFGNLPGAHAITTTDATVTEIWRCYMADDEILYLEAIIVGIDTSSPNQVLYKIAGLFYCTASTASQIGNTINMTPQLTSSAITDPGDAPATADALRDDLVANAIPDIEAAFDALIIEGIESDTDWDIGWQLSANQVRIRVTGKAAQTVNWRAHVTTKVCR